MTTRVDTRTTTDVVDVEIKRVFDAPRDQVYRAWTEAEAIGLWMGPEGTVAEVTEFDPQPGGGYRIVIKGEERDYPVAGTFVDVSPPERLVLTWIWETGDYAGVETLVELTFAAVPEGTELSLVHRRLPDWTAAERHTEGWTSTFRCLAAYLEA